MGTEVSSAYGLSESPSMLPSKPSIILGSAYSIKFSRVLLLTLKSSSMNKYALPSEITKFILTGTPLRYFPK